MRRDTECKAAVNDGVAARGASFLFAKVENAKAENGKMTKELELSIVTVSHLDNPMYPMLKASLPFLSSAEKKHLRIGVS